MSLLAMSDVTYRYPGAPEAALSGVDLAVEPGELVVVAGGSGSGKSTLLRVVNGLVPHFHGGTFGGRAVVAGMDTREAGPGELARAVGSLFQDPETQVVMGTVRSELAFPLENAGAPAGLVARGVEEAALAMGIAHLLDRSTAELSGGELQRAALAAALIGKPALVVLDEPTSQLDPVAGDELMGLLRRLNDDLDTAILLAEHRLERCLPAADRVVALVEGEIAFDGAPGAFLAWAESAAPELATPGGRLLSGLGLPPVPGVRGARAALRAAGSLPGVGAAFLGDHASESDAIDRDRPQRRRLGSPKDMLGRRRSVGALRFDHVWHELHQGATILRDVSLTLEPGERLALMGRNGAGKTTLLRHAAGLMAPTRGRIQAGGRVALLLQNPTDYLVAETVRQEATPAAMARVGLDTGRLGERNPRDLSGGEKQRLALAIVLGGGCSQPAADGPEAAAYEKTPTVLCLDEPTRGMDRQAKDALARLLKQLGCAALVTTHDPEFAAAFAQRVVLLAEGRIIAEGTPGEVLADGTYFATETARILRRLDGGDGPPGAPVPLTPAEALNRIRQSQARQEVPA